MLQPASEKDVREEAGEKFGQKPRGDKDKKMKSREVNANRKKRIRNGRRWGWSL